MTHSQGVLITLICYKLVLVLIGVLAQRKTRDGVDFFLGGRRLGPWVAAISSAASSSSAWTLLGVSGAAYAWGLSAVWLFPSCVGGFSLNWFILAPALRKVSFESGALTVTEILAGPRQSRYHRAIVIVCSVIVLVSLGTYVSSQFQGAAKTFSETFGLSIVTSILLGSGIVVFYTLLGGFWAVSITDMLQGVVMALASVLLPVAAVISVGGLTPLYEGMAGVDVPGYLSLSRNLGPVAGLGFVLGLLGIGLGYPGQPHVVNRFMALRQGDSALRRGRQVAIGWALIVFSGMLLLGWSSRILYPGLDDPEVAFVVVANQLFHPLIAGVLVASVLSAIMSTADSQLLVAGSAVTHDLKLGGHSQEALLFRSRIVILLLSLGAVLGALFGSQEIFSQVLFAFSAMGSAFGPLLLVTVLRGPVPSGPSLVAILTGFSLSVVFYIIPDTRGTGLERALPFVLALAIAWQGGKSTR